MSIFEVGRVCMKIAGRDAGRTCVVVEDLGKGYVVVDGDVRRKKVNVRHLEPLDNTVELKAKADHSAVAKAFEKLKPVREKRYYSRKRIERDFRFRHSITYSYKGKGKRVYG